MKATYTLSVCVAALLSGCATEANFTKALEQPVKAANAAQLVLVQAELDMEKARVMGWLVVRPAKREELATMVCERIDTIANTKQSLGAFGEALDLIKDVGEKPADISYSGYLQQYRKNKESLAAARAMEDETLATEQATQAAKALKEARARCIALYLSDINPENKLVGKSSGESYKAVTALSTLIKALVGLGESVQRDKAVRDTAVALIPGLARAQSQLAAAPDKSGPRVQYSRGTGDVIAYNMADTRLGAAVSVRRWFVARQIGQALKRVQECQEACLGDPLARMTLDNLVTDIAAYRSLSQIDTGKTLTALKSGVDNAQIASTSPGNWAQILDGLLQAADAMDGLKTNYKDYKTSRE